MRKIVAQLVPRIPYLRRSCLGFSCYSWQWLPFPPPPSPAQSGGRIRQIGGGDHMKVASRLQDDLSKTFPPCL
jgi:hypothetical protein